MPIRFAAPAAPSPANVMATEAPAAAARPTPVMEQYIEIKAANPDCLLFYRMGDFYELFFGDAEIASQTLGIALTHRGKHLGADIPMAGVPVHAADDYLQRLIAAGHRVAVCEQVENPAEARKRGGKSVVRREVVRLITPGTLTEDNLLDARTSNFLLAAARGRAGEGDRFGLAWIDLSTGVFRVGGCSAAGLAAELARTRPREILLADAVLADPALASLWRECGAATTPLPAAVFDGATAEARLAGFFGVATIEAFGNFDRLELAAASAALAYVEKTQIGSRPALAPPAREAGGATMVIDPATRANLEIATTLAGERRGSLLAAIDRTITGPGSRLLAERLASPSTDPALIRRRLDAVATLVDAGPLRRVLRRQLTGAPDMPRALSRLALDRGGPRDLAAIAAGLDTAAAAATELAGLDTPPGSELSGIAGALAAVPAGLAPALRAALADDLPHLKRDGGFVRAGARPELDAARALRDESRRVIAALQAAYAAETELRGLRIKHNNVLGYFVEVAAGPGDRLLAAPHAQKFIHRQTMAGALRFTTAELGDLEARIAGAADRALAIEMEVFDQFRAAVLAAAEPVRAAASALAALDAAAGLAQLAEAENYCRPEVDATLAFRIAGGRHPVVEQARREAGESFVANDCDLGATGGGEGRIWLLTGPNMAGKSTFLRQNALIAVLAQAGSFVPARAAHIGVVDRLFSRVGAADDLARGRSTFMVEMVETAAILNQAGPRALVILDEIGRGTATFDGLSIAWAAIEHLHNVNRSRALFATHYHELTALAERLPRLRNATVKVKEWRGEVAFLHEIVAGAADRSYGIQVARLAGLPRPVVERAREILKRLEAGERRGPAAALIGDLPLFSGPPASDQGGPPPAEHGDVDGQAPYALDGAPGADDRRLDRTGAPPDPALAALDALRPDDLSPREALEALYRLKALRA